MKLVSVEEMLAIEKEADAAGLSYASMMENAGRGLAGILQGLERDGASRVITGLIGPGNNGGDALVALSELSSSGWIATAYLVHRGEDPLVDRLRKAGGRILAGADDPDRSRLSDAFLSAAMILDGLLGTGSKPPVTGEVAEILRRANALLATLDQPPYVVAVDCPSGIDCDSGEVPEHCLPADLTVTMAAVKQGLLRLPAFEYVGALQAVDIGLPRDLPSLKRLQVEVADEVMVAGILPRRAPDSHKGTFGTALVVAGALNYPGAALLAAKAAYLSGAGLVKLAVPAPLQAILAGHIPEATWLPLPHELGAISGDAAHVLAEALSGCSALLIGPGLGMANMTSEFLQRLIAPGFGPLARTTGMGFLGSKGAALGNAGHSLPALVVDADGLKLLAPIPDWPRMLPASSVLTPHPGEMAILTGMAKDDIQRNRLLVALKHAREWGQVIVLKGAFSIVASPDGRATLIPVASAALARAGTGDVLAGLIVGLRAQGVGAYDAAVAGAWIHAQAGLQAAAKLGTDVSVLAGDVMGAIAEVIASLPPN